MPSYPAADGIRLEYEDAGTGNPLVFVHGWMMSSRFFRHQIDDLSKTHRVIAPNLRGCGGSHARPETHDIPHFASDLANLIERLGLRHITLVGWSMGAAVALEYMAHHARGRIARLGIIDFPPRFTEDPTVADKVCNNLATKRDSFVTGFLHRMFKAPPTADAEAWMIAEASKCSKDSACAMYRAMSHAPPLEHVRRDTPAFLAFPEGGWFPRATQEWTKMFPKNATPAFEASRHCPFLEEPERFNQVFRAFLARTF